MSKCPVCLEEYTTHGCQCMKEADIKLANEGMSDYARLLRAGDGYEGLEEIERIMMLEAALSELLTPKLNEIIEKVNLLIRLKKEANNGHS